MAGILQTTPWSPAPYPAFGAFGLGSPAASMAALAPWSQSYASPLSIVPQQLQQAQAQQQLLLIALQQIQQLQQAIQFLPQHVAQLVAQTLIQTQANVPVQGVPGFGIPFQPVQAFGQHPQVGQPAYVM